MENISLRSVLARIRSFFSSLDEPSPDLPAPVVNRKRRATNTEAVLSPNKLSRLSGKSSKTRIIPIQIGIDDVKGFNFHPPTYSLSQQTQAFRKPMRQLPVQKTFVVDDDNLTEIKKPSFRKFEVNGRTTSTPIMAKARYHFNENRKENDDDDDVILVNTTMSTKQKEDQASSTGFTYIRPKEKSLFTIGQAHIERGGVKTKAHKKLLSNDSKGQSMMDYSYRLDEKSRYKEILELSIDLAKKSSEGRNNCKETVSETISRVLDSTPTEPILIKDSDSEDSVVFVNPPFPRPEFKVDPVNSLKKIVDTSNASRKDWLDQLVDRYSQKVERRQKEIDTLREHSRQSGLINKDINIELLRRKVNDCLQIKEVVLPEIEVRPEADLPPLTDAQLRMVQKAFKGNPNEILAKKFNLSITRRDLMTLAGLNWLNDEVINFYMNLIIERGKDSKFPKTYAFNTFFYTKLLKDGPQSLRRWTKRVDIFSHDLICVPIHLGMHWCMAIVDFRDKSIRYYDSMGSPNSRCLQALRNYLEAEHVDKKMTEYDTSDFILENMTDIPQQMNGSDCGMFACTFAEFISRNALITFKQDDMQYLRSKMVVEIMTGELLIR